MEERQNQGTTELAIVIAGAWLYWRAARQSVASFHSLRARANLSGLLVLIFGVLVLVVDVLG